MVKPEEREVSEMEAMLRANIRDIPDFPKPGIVFKDITPLLQNREAFAATIDSLVGRYRDKSIDVIVGIESRGFLFGAPLAHQLGVSFVPLRKKGKLPYKTVDMTYDLEYGTATVEMHTDSISRGQRVLIVDDLLATGGTAGAACKLVRELGGKVVECAFVVELAFLDGRSKIEGTPVYSMISYS